jgi:hypothetical protein
MRRVVKVGGSAVSGPVDAGDVAGQMAAEVAFAGHESPLVRHAYAIARDKYGLSRLPNGESYVSHAERVASLALSAGGSEVAVSSALLHKLDFRLPHKPPKGERDGIGPGEWNAVRAHANALEDLTRRPFFEFKGSYAVQNYMNMLINSCDADLMLLLLSDKLGSIATAIPSEAERMSQEVKLVYAPLAERVGLYGFADGFREHVFRLTQPGDYRRTTADLGMVLAERLGLGSVDGESDEARYGRAMAHAREFLGSTAASLKRVLDEGGIEATVSSRVKSPYSIWKKLNYTTYDTINDLPDIFGVQIVHGNPADMPGIVTVVYDMNEERMPPTIDTKHPNAKKGSGYEAYHMDMKVAGIGTEFQLLSWDSYVKRETEKSHWQRDIRVREMPGQQFDERTERITGEYYADYDTVKAALSEWAFVLYVEERGRGYVMTPLRLRRGAIPADVAATRTVDGLDRGYAGMVRLEFGRDRGSEELVKPRRTMLAEDHMLRDGDMVLITKAAGRQDSAFESSAKVSAIIKNCVEDRTAQMLEDAMSGKKKTR